MIYPIDEGVAETEHDDELILSTELGPTVGDDGESDDDTNEGDTQEGPDLDDFQCTWGALGDSFDVVPMIRHYFNFEN
jgi:hypothetical protein